MWLTIVLGILNVILSSVGTYVFGLPGLDLTLAGVIILGLRGENVFVGALVLSIAYMLPKPDRFFWLPIQLLGAWLAGWVAATFGMAYASILIFHTLSLAWGGIVGSIGGRLLMHTLVNIGLTLVVVRFYLMIT